MNKAPAFQVYPKDYETDEKVKLMTLEQEGAYWRLLLHQSLEGSVPADISGLALICRVPKGRMKKLWTGTLPLCFPAVLGPPGRLANLRMERDRRERQEFIRGKAAAGTLGGLAKAKQTSSTPEDFATDLPDEKPSPPYSVLQSSPSSPTDNPPKPPSGGVLTRSPSGTVFAHWQAVMGHRDAKPTPKRMRLIQARLKDGYTVEQLCTAVDGCRLSRFHRGENDRGQVYDDLALICRDGEHVEQFLRHAANGSGGPALMSPLSKHNAEALGLLRGDA
jgi:hypothetical protein